MTDENVVIMPGDEELYDAAMRMRDVVNLHVAALRELGRDHAPFVGIRLSDGRSPDNVLYETRRDCARYFRNQPDVFPCRIGADTMSPREAMVVLRFRRAAYARGVIFSEEEVVLPHLAELHAQAREVMRHRTLLRGDPE